MFGPFEYQTCPPGIQMVTVQSLKMSPGFEGTKGSDGKLPGQIVSQKHVCLDGS